MKYLGLGDRLKALREKQSLSLQQLSLRVDIEEKDLEAFEANLEAPKIAELIRLAKALHVNVADILRDRPTRHSYEILRKVDRQKHSPLLHPNKDAKVTDYSYEMLTLPSDDKHLDAYLIEVPAFQTKQTKASVHHPGEEFIYVLEGSLKAQLDGEEIDLNQGDSLFLRSSVEHIFWNPYEHAARALSVIYPF